MKWPETLTLIRHGESTYNKLKREMEIDPLWQGFVRLFDDHFDSEETFRMARELKDKYSLGLGDHEVPLTEFGRDQAERMATILKEMIGLPGVVFVSPYLRTLQTFEAMKKGWAELREVVVYEEERIREQDHGLQLLYCDWRIFYAFHPEQKDLYELEGPYWYRYPQGESIPDVRERNRSWAATIIRKYSGKEVVAITHRLTILSVRAFLERMGSREFAQLNQTDKPINCGVTIYRGDPRQGRDGRFVLEMYNKKLY